MGTVFVPAHLQGLVDHDLVLNRLIDLCSPDFGGNTLTLMGTRSASEYRATAARR